MLIESVETTRSGVAEVTIQDTLIQQVGTITVTTY